jgi:1,4-alpha-glucan branching enzyme
MILTLDRNWTEAKLNEVLEQFDMKALNTDSAFRYLSAGKLASDGWMIRRKGRNKIEVYKKLNNLEGVNLIGVPVCIDQSFPDIVDVDKRHQFTNKVFGYNRFEGASVIELENGFTEFRITTKPKVEKVLLSGTFNNWSTSELPMLRSGDDWVAMVKLNPGRHEYKFIIDGAWRRDPLNELKLDDGYAGFNSVYFKTNASFKLKGYEGAGKVILSGTFNDWNDEIELKKTDDGWALDVFLPDGTYFYKFIVDGNWITDPANPEERTDAGGNINSVIAIGKPTRFELRNFEQARQVVLTGTFNKWNEGELIMTQDSNKTWISEYVLGPGTYTYKYIVDGQWKCDQTKPVIPNEFDSDMNNFLVVDPNFTFRLDQHQQAKTVSVTGNFIDWSEPGFPLEKKDGYWELPVHLKNGKVLYKFIVDGNYILDPANGLYEENEFGTGNSFIWIE